MKLARSTRPLLALLLLLALCALVLPSRAAPAPAVALTKRVYLPSVRNPVRFGSVTPNPVTISLAMDPTPAPVVVDAETGGRLTATGSNGATYTLDIPADALLSDTAITLTPIKAATRLPGGTIFRAGVTLQPEGLRFYRPVSLSMTPTVAVAPEREAAWAAQGGGQHTHAYPLALGTSAVRFDIIHFSEYIFSEFPPLTTGDPPPVPGPTEAQVEQAVAELIRTERARQLRGEEPDPTFGSKLVELLRAYYAVGIGPLLPIAETRCREAGPIVAKALGWARQVELLGAGTALDLERTIIWNSARMAIENCWNEVTKPCLNQSDPAEMARAIAIARQAQLLGMDPDRFNPFRTTPCDCTGVARVTSGWKVTLNYQWSESASGPPAGGGRGTESASAQHLGAVTARLTTTDNPTSGRWKGLVSGAAELRDRTDYRYEDYHAWSEMRGSGAPLTATANGPVEAWISFNGSQCTYSLWIPTWLNVRHTDADTDFTLATVATNFWVAVLPVKWTAQENAFVVQDTWSIEIGSERERARFQVNSAADSYLSWIRGTLPRADVTWRIEPAAPPLPGPPAPSSQRHSFDRRTTEEIREVLPGGTHNEHS